MKCILLWRVRLLDEKDVFIVSILNSFLERYLREKSDKCCCNLKSHHCNSKAHRVINLELTLRLPGQKLCRQCVTEYEKFTKPPKNGNMIEMIETESSQDKLASEMIFCSMNHQKRKLTRLSKALDFPQLISMELPNTVAFQMQKVN